MEIRSLRHFVAVADTLNFRVAGERLHLTQPALTRSIAALELELGVLLFNRDTRGVALTAHGAQLLQRARGVLADADEFTYAAHALRAAAASQVRVGLYGNGLAELTHPVLSAFCERYPDAAVQVRDADFARGIEPLIAGEYDVAFLRVPVDLPVLRTFRLFSEPMDIHVWDGHWLAGAASAEFREIFDDPWVTLPPSIPTAWSASWLFSEQRGGVAPNIGAFARTEGEFGAAVAYRRLSGVLPTSVHRLRPHTGVAVVRAAKATYSHVAVSYPASGFSPAAAAMAEVAVEVAARDLHLVPEAERPPSR
ncbi:MAG: LysR family transcriptional regulator [Microbacterium aurantiacum]|uniref:LysR family transcriptional regulator n=1 Tax=Microbacterium aurantiacum TaxID=162393 RepID=UPI00403569A7